MFLGSVLSFSIERSVKREMFPSPVLRSVV